MRVGPLRTAALSIAISAVAIAGLAGCATGSGGPNPNSGAVGDLMNARVAAGAPTFHADVLPILQANCQACHRSDGRAAGGLVAPMALETYEATRPWAMVIAKAVADGRMPPWGADIQHKGTFIGERYLEESDKRTLIAWAEAGAPEGDPADAPPRLAVDDAPEDGEWWLGEPDLIVGFAKPVHVADSIHDWQPTIHVPVPAGAHTEARWIRSSELKAGGPYVHHIVSSHLGVGTPGRAEFSYPEGFGVLLPTDPTITFNMHYYKKPGPGTGIYDQTLGAFKFYEPGQVVDHIVQTDLNWNRDFLIPAGDPNYEVKRAMPFAEDTYLLSMGPHMHYRGKAVRMELEYPTGEKRLLLWVPDYDFNWQFLYQFEEPVLMPAGSVLHTTWWFDNSADNPYNPDPTVDVRYGIETFNEMANARIYFAPAKKRGIVVGEPIPEDVVARARQEEEGRRAQLERTGAIDDH